MGEHGGEADEARVFIDDRGLEGGDLVPTEAFADDLEAAGKRRSAWGRRLAGRSTGLPRRRAA